MLGGCVVWHNRWMCQHRRLQSIVCSGMLAVPLSAGFVTMFQLPRPHSSCCTLAQVYHLHIHSAAATLALYNTIDPDANVYFSTHPVRQVSSSTQGCTPNGRLQQQRDTLKQPKAQQDSASDGNMTTSWPACAHVTGKLHQSFTASSTLACELTH